MRRTSGLVAIWSAAVTPVVGMWHADLFQDRLALREGRRDGRGPDRDEARSAPHSRGHSVLPSPLDLRNNPWGSRTSRSSRSSVALGGAMAPSRGRRVSGHPTPFWTSSAVTPG